MKNIFLLFAFLLLTIMSCGKIKPEGNISTEVINVEDYSTLELEGNYRLFFVQNPKNFVEIETYPNLYENLKVKVTDGVLKISEHRPTKNVDFYNVTVYGRVSPTKITASDSIEINISGALKTDNFRLNLKNNAKFIGALNSRKAEINMLNTSRANFSGSTNYAVIKTSDTANIIAPYWVLNNVNLIANNGSYTELNVRDSVKGHIQNTAKFLYYNDPIRAFKVDKSAQVTNKNLP